MSNLTRMFLVVAAIVAGCTVHESTTRAAGPYDMTCHVIHDFPDITRCENAEVICYTDSPGISCFQKGK